MRVSLGLGGFGSVPLWVPLCLQMGLEMEVTPGRTVRNKISCFPEGVTKGRGWWSSALRRGEHEEDGISGWQKALGGWR